METAGDNELHENVVFVAKPKKKDSPEQAQLSYLQNVVLMNCDITHSGIGDAGLAQLCPNVVDLDLTSNKLSHWSDLLCIMRNLPRLKFANFTGNQIHHEQDIVQSSPNKILSVENIVLNGTGVSWEVVNDLTKLMPNLTELHLCRNGYHFIATDLTSMQKLECLRLNDNNLTDWTEVWKLRTLNKLKTLILSENPLRNVFYKSDIAKDECIVESLIQELIFKVTDNTHSACADASTEVHSDRTEDCEFHTEVAPEEPFAHLHTLCVSRTHLSSLEDLQALAAYPSLKNLRIRETKLFPSEDSETVRKMLLACLPTLDQLNGGSVTQDEKHKAERFFLRYFNSRDPKPEQYARLVQIHGELTDLPDVDIGSRYREEVTLGFVMQNDVIHEGTISTREPLGYLRQYISRKLLKEKTSSRCLTVYHYFSGEGHRNTENECDLQELRGDALPLSRFDMCDGDQIHIDVFDDPRFRPQALKF